ncbi:MAG: glycosyltransferase [Acetobacteraceae bacterium]|nr:glycosyltransferase [Acetobacteraceae bacterium]
MRLLGLDFADLTAAAAARAIAARPTGAGFSYVVTPNADHLVRLARDPALAALYQHAWLRLLDSRVVAGLAGLCGLRAPAVSPGSDLTALLLRRHIEPGERIAIVGMRPAWVPLLEARCGLAPCVHHDPPMGFDRDPAAMARAVSFVLAHPARFVFFAVGSPRQEFLAAAVAATGQAVGTGLCVGASLAFLAGVERRAPVWMQRHRLEWAFRLANDPRRLARRYLLDSPQVVPMLLRERLGARPSVNRTWSNFRSGCIGTTPSLATAWLDATGSENAPGEEGVEVCQRPEPQAHGTAPSRHGPT